MPETEEARLDRRIRRSRKLAWFVTGGTGVVALLSFLDWSFIIIALAWAGMSVWSFSIVRRWENLRPIAQELDHLEAELEKLMSELERHSKLGDGGSAG